MFLLLIAFFFINSKYKPFSTTPLNELEILSLITSIITVYCGLFFASDIDASIAKSIPELQERALNLSSSTKMVLFVIIVLANAFFFGYWAYKMYQEVKSKIRKAIPKLYTMLCLCGDQAKYLNEIRSHEIMIENEMLKEEFLK